MSNQDRLSEDEKIETAAMTHATFLSRGESTIGQQLGNVQRLAEELGLQFQPARLENFADRFIDPVIEQIRQRARSILDDRSAARRAAPAK